MFAARSHAAALLVLLLPAVSLAAAPRIAGDVPTWAFGAVERGTRVEHTFVLPNRGDAQLVIDQVKTTCGCTAAVVSAREIPPGGEARVAVSLDTAHLGGHTTKVISVHTNDPERAVVSLALTGDVLADLLLDPDALYLGRVRRGEPVRRELLVTPGRPGSAAAVTAVEPTSSMLRARLEPRTDGPGQRLVVELDPRAPLGRFHDELHLRTTSARQPVIAVAVFGSVEGDVVVLPPQVSFGVTHAAARPEREVFIRSRTARPLTVTRVAAPEELVAWELSPVREGFEYRLLLRLREGLRAGKIESAVEIFTDHPDEQRLVVPIYAIVRRG
jgi:uncharacterized protein DUF1573